MVGGRFAARIRVIDGAMRGGWLVGRDVFFAFCTRLGPIFSVTFRAECTFGPVPDSS